MKYGPAGQFLFIGTYETERDVALALIWAAWQVARRSPVKGLLPAQEGVQELTVGMMSQFITHDTDARILAHAETIYGRPCGLLLIRSVIPKTLKVTYPRPEVFPEIVEMANRALVMDLRSNK